MIDDDRRAAMWLVIIATRPRGQPPKAAAGDMPVSAAAWDQMYPLPRVRAEDTSTTQPSYPLL